jgi:hypothetical protein
MLWTARQVEIAITTAVASVLVSIGMLLIHRSDAIAAKLGARTGPRLGKTLYRLFLIFGVCVVGLLAVNRVVGFRLPIPLPW